MVSSLTVGCVDNKHGVGGFATSGLQRTGYGLYTNFERGGFTAPLFLTVSLSPPNFPTHSPGDTDPRVPLALTGPLAQYRDEEVLLQRNKDKITVLIDEMLYQSDQMESGGKKAWWDAQDFKQMLPTGVSYECKQALGVLSVRECRTASWEFIRKGALKVQAGVLAPTFQSGNCLFSVEAARGEVEVPWDALRAAADILSYTCLEKEGSPGSGGLVVFTGAPGPSTGFIWPDALLLTMKMPGIQGQGAIGGSGGNGGNGTAVTAGGQGGTNLTRPRVVVNDPGLTS
ncbi:uncharacterized protein KY384_001725 [Bacidia gigantensis]|uniref:uncharacterized protein n=1 Tax=Bacidia gigantensis TaxID=2732470 RepID=UPI001D048BA3|nr:uncharacterized protein KY384_001725 [Bacidia gigantensis]KAG8533982.1 hypothetical protein KY384_001725 [Bacidia gigantensis]